MESRVGANMRPNDEKSVEKLMDEHLRANGLYRKKIAKDGSCLFRAVAEQVLHCQGLHTRVRAECVKYIREKRDLYESFIEGDFEEYLHMLQDPQSWVGQVEISALAVLYKHDFIIYQQPGEPPVNITQNGYPDQVLLCFLNGNHYDSVYPISSVKSAAVCQSILYELLYERVYGVDRSVLTPSLRVSKARPETVGMVEHESSADDSDLDQGEDFWSSEITGRTAGGVNNRTAYKGRGRGQARGVGRGCLLRKVQDSLNPTLLRNVEYEVWLRSERVQQRRDFCMAAGMHYKAGDKCQVRLNNAGRFYSAYIQDVSPDDGPVTVFIEELGERHDVPLWNLRTPSEDSWSTVTEKSKKQSASSSNGLAERDPKPGRKPVRSVSHGLPASSGSAPGNSLQQQHSWPSQASAEPQSLEKDGGNRRSSQAAGRPSVSEGNKQVLLELLNKDEENFPTLEASAQAASVEGSKRAEKKGSRKKAGTDTKEQSLNPVHIAEREKQENKHSVDQDQKVSPPCTEEGNLILSATLPAPPAPKSTKAAPSSTAAPTRVPYKKSSLSARNPPIQSAPASSARPLDSFQTTPLQSPSTHAPCTGPLDSFQATTIQSQTAPSPSIRQSGSVKSTPAQSPTAPSISTGPLESFQTTRMQSSTAPAPSTKTIVLFKNTPLESQAALEQSESIPVSSLTTLVQPEPFLIPATSVLTPVSSQCPPTTVPKAIPVASSSLPQTSQTIQSQVSDPTATVTTPLPLYPVQEGTTTPISSQTTTMPLSPTTTTSNPVSTPLSLPSPFQTVPAPPDDLSKTTLAPAQGPVSAHCQITSAPEVTGLTDFAACLKSPARMASEQTDLVGVPTPVHAPHSSTPPAQPSPFLTPSYPVGLGTHLPYPPYPPYLGHVPPISPISAPMPDPCFPPSVPTPPFSHAAESYSYELAGSPVAAGAGAALLSDPPPQHPVTLAQLCQDMLYPGFPQNNKGEPLPPPPFALDNTGKDLPSDTSVLRFFFNLGVKAYTYQMLPPVTYLTPLVQAYHMQLKVCPAWQPDNPRPIFPFPNPSPAGSTPASHFDLRAVVRTPSPFEVGLCSHHSLPMQMPLPIPPHPIVYAGAHSVPPAGPPLQYSATPSSVGLPHISVPPPQHYRMEVPIPTASPMMEGGQGGQGILNPQVEKTLWGGQDQKDAEDGDIKPEVVPVIMGVQHSGGAQAASSGGVSIKGMELTKLANGNRQEKSGGFMGSSIEDWETQKTEFGDAGLKTGRSYPSQSYKSRGRYAQDERGGYRGRGARGRTGGGRYDGQLFYHRGFSGRSRGRGYNNARATGYPGRQDIPAPES